VNGIGQASPDLPPDGRDPEHGASHVTTLTYIGPVASAVTIPAVREI
jgi:hypothetical protein